MEAPRRVLGRGGVLIGSTAALETHALTRVFKARRKANDGDLWRIIAGATLGLCLAAILWFGWCERYARDRGLIDWKTNY